MWDAFAFGRYELFCRELRDLLDYAGASKVLFGTDNPIFSVVFPTKEWIALLKGLPTKAPAGIQFTREEVDGILGGNAAQMLGLESAARA
jgi:predicted TIM-barrel fold metal-dependent hydrolase